MTKAETIRTILDAAAEGNQSKAEEALDGYYNKAIEDAIEVVKGFRTMSTENDYQGYSNIIEKIQFLKK